MAEEYVLPQPETLSIGLHDADKLISAGSGDAALLYLYVLRRNGRLDAEKAREELHLGDRLDAALSTLQKLGLVRLPGGYAAIRVQEQQKQAEKDVPDCLVVSAKDLSTPLELHPQRKSELGARLYEAGKKLFY